MKPTKFGVIVLLFLLPTLLSAGDFHKLTDRVSLSNLTTHIRMLERAGGHYSRVTYTAGSDSGIAYIKRAFDALPNLSSVRCETLYVPSASAPYNSMPLVNIEATIRGRTNPSAVYVVGAHHDCSGSRMGSTLWSQQWSSMTVPGADDNATGVASLLEIARILSDTTLGFINNFTIKLVAFGAEESSPAYASLSSHQGSIYYAQQARARGEQILGMISVDMVGYNPYSTAIDIVLPTSSSTACQQLGNEIVKANNDNAIGLTLNSAPYNVGTYSDHKSFWDAGYGAILLIERNYSANPYYHKSGDTTGTLNLEQVRRTAKVTLATIAGLAGGLTGVAEAAEQPGNFALEQNYPNPFNPSTTIAYTVGLGERVSGRGGEGEEGNVPVQLTVYDILGRQIAVLVNEPQRPGHYSVRFNGAEQATGMYFYRLRCGSYHQTRRMLFLK